MASGLKKYSTKKDEEELNLLTVLTPIYIMLSLVGLFPYSLKLRNRPQKPSIIPKSIYLNLFCALCYTLLMSVFFAMHLYYIFYLHFDNSLTKGDLARVNYVIEMFVLILFCVVGYYSVYDHRLNVLYILNKMSAIIVASNSGSTKILKKLQSEVKMVIFWLIFILMAQMIMNATRDDSWWKVVLVLFTFLVPQMIEFCMVAFFYIIMLSIKELLKNIRENYIPSMYININDRSIKTVESKQSVSNIRQAELIYLDVLEIIQYVTRIFEAPFLLIVVQCLHTVVSEVYILYTGIAKHQSLTTHDIINCAIWTVYQYIKIFVIAKAGTAFKLEVQQLGFSILHVPVEKQDIRFLLEIQHMTSLIQLQRSELTIYGYLSLDATLIFKMVTASMTYIIIVMQFIR